MRVKRWTGRCTQRQLPSRGIEQKPITYLVNLRICAVLFECDGDITFGIIDELFRYSVERCHLCGGPRYDRKPRLLIWSPVLVDFIPLLKFQDSTLLTPPRASKLGDDIDWLVNAKLESPPIINKPLGKDDNNKLHRYANICHGLSYQQWSRSNLFTFTQEIHRVNAFRQAGWNHT